MPQIGGGFVEHRCRRLLPTPIGSREARHEDVHPLGAQGRDEGPCCGAHVYRLGPVRSGDPADVCGGLSDGCRRVLTDHGAQQLRVLALPALIRACHTAGQSEGGRTTREVHR